MLKIKNLTVTIYGKTILNDISLDVKAGQWLMIIGPNGAGKSTLISAVSRQSQYSGQIFIDGEDISRMKNKEIARQLGVLTQHHTVGYGFSVDEVVSLGRYSHSKGFLATPPGDDLKYIKNAIEMTGLQKLQHQSVLTLSGGELQRTFLAQLFAQDPRILMLDEPTNHLDLIYQKQVFELIKDWLKHPGRCVVSVVHDLSLARAYGTHAMLIKQGNVIAYGEISKAMTDENLNKAYDMDVKGWMKKLLEIWK